MALPNPLDFVWHQCFSWAAMSVMVAQRHFTASLIQMGVWCDRLRNHLPENGCDIEYADTEQITSIPWDCRVNVLAYVASKPKVVLQLRRPYPKLVCGPTLQMRSLLHTPGMACQLSRGTFSRVTTCVVHMHRLCVPSHCSSVPAIYVIARARKARSGSDHVSDA
jgi:hypothetical protein